MSLSPNQLKAVDLFATGNHTGTEIAELIGVSRNSITSWRKKTEFTNACVDKAQSYLYKDLPIIYKALKKEAKNGSIQHIKTILDHLDNLNEVRQESIEGTIVFQWQQ